MSTTLMENLRQTAERVRRATVQVEGHGGGGGAGVVWHADGLIVTNAHVARRSTGRIRLSDGRVVTVSVAARDPQIDLALLRSDGGDWAAAEKGDSDGLRPGQIILAVGSPYGHSGAVTAGIVHSAGSGRWIEADIRLAPGNSGGPLADAEGRVVGINTMVARGLALAIPSRVVERFIARQGRPARQLGITVKPVNIPGFGLLILEVERGSPADHAGLKTGDIVVGAGGRPFQAPFDLALALDTGATSFRLDLLRGGRPASCDVSFEPAEAEVG